MRTKMRLEGITLTVKSVKRSVDFYTQKLGFVCELNAAPHFAMLRMGGERGYSIGLQERSLAKKKGAVPTLAKQNRAIHIELTTEDLDSIYKELLAKGVHFHTPRTMNPGNARRAPLIQTIIPSNSPKDAAAKTNPRNKIPENFRNGTEFSRKIRAE